MKKLKRRWWKIYRDRKGKYRVSARASNGRKVWASSQGYRGQYSAFENAYIEGDAPLALYGHPLGVELKTEAERLA